MAPHGGSAGHAIEIVDDESTASEGDDEGARPGVKRRRPRRGSGESPEDVSVKVEWTDDSDGGYERLKKRRRGTPWRSRGRPRGQRRAAGESSRSSSRRPSGSRSRPAEPKDEDKDKDDADIPDYLAERRRAFEARHTQLREAGLCLPPDYSDIFFSDDERADTAAGRARGGLQTRPQFDSSVRTWRANKDVVLAYSGGVLPGPIARYLRDYQVTGVQFLHRLFVYQRGGVLGDDMGLGKTVQVAAFLAAAFGKTGDERDDKRMRKMRRREEADPGRWYPVVLVVCPGSVIENWRQELQRWGWWHVDVYHGAGKDDVLQAARAGRLEIMVTTYATYKNHRERINTVRWDAVVADECHVLKERDAETTRAMHDVNALCRIGLTGTAIQNRYEELWTLLDWTNPGRFGTRAEWRATISKPLAVGQSHDATLLQLSLARRTARQLVHNLLPDCFLRRMKSLIAHQLPRKTDRVVFCPLTARQSDAYARLVASPAVVALQRVGEPCACGSGRKAGWCCDRLLPDGKTPWFATVFPTIQALLKLANHLMLLVPADGGGSSADKAKASDRHDRAMAVLQTCVPDGWTELYAHRDSLTHLADPAFCGKWKVLRKLLRFWHESGDKVLVFSHNVRLLRILLHLFHSTSYSVSYLDGALSYEERQRVVDDFNADPAQFVFLISTKAGGVGLNIASANKVVIFDPHWNPAYDLQAQDRAYRIGQVRDVDVFRLVSAGTIEEVVYARQIYKQQQANIGYSASTERRYFRGVQQDSERKGEIFGLNNLLAFHADHVMLRDIVNKTNIAEAKAGVRLTDIDMDQAAADRENDVLAQLEGHSETPSRAEPKSDAIQAILASAGVEYTHDNAEVVGSSRVEAQLSRRAERVLDGRPDVDVEDVQPDVHTSTDNTDPEWNLLLADTSAAFVSAADPLAGRRLRYNPPADVMRRQFCAMAREAGFATATDFALVVESWTPEQRRHCLEQFYRRREARLREVAEAEAETVEAEGKTEAKSEVKVKQERENVVKEEKEDVVKKNQKVDDAVLDAEIRRIKIKKEHDVARIDLAAAHGLDDTDTTADDTDDAPPGRDNRTVVVLSSSPLPVKTELKMEPKTEPAIDVTTDDETDEL